MRRIVHPPLTSVYSHFFLLARPPASARLAAGAAFESRGQLFSSVKMGDPCFCNDAAAAASHPRSGRVSSPLSLSLSPRPLSFARSPLSGRTKRAGCGGRRTASRWKRKEGRKERGLGRFSDTHDEFVRVGCPVGIRHVQ